MKVKTLCISLAILTTVCLMAVTASPAASITTRDYWILTDGYSAQFTNSGTLNVTYGNFNGKNVFFINLMGTGTQMQNYDASGNLLYYGTRHGSGWYFTVNPPAALFPSKIEIGKTYPPVSWQRMEYDSWGWYHGTGSDSVVVTVTDLKMITVPAGSFEVYKFTLVDTWSDSWGDSGVSTSEYWMAKDMGWVKVRRGGVTYELLNMPILPPTATTGTATSVSTSTATLNGTVNPRGGSTTVVFEYGPTTGYGTQITATQSPLSGTTDQAVSTQLTGLSECTPYHFRAKATNSADTTWGEDQTFTTSCGSKPTVKTNHASQVTLNSAKLNGKVNPNGADTTWYFEYGLTIGYEWSTPSESAGSGSTKVPVSRNITGLSRDTTYHYRIVAENSRGESLGKDKTFRTTIIYVEPYGACGAKAPCYSTIQDAIDEASSGGTIKIAEESYDEDVAIGASGNVRIEGGWDVSFTARSSIAESSSTAITLVIGSEMDGTVFVDGLVLQTEPIPVSPTVTTGSAISVTSSSATLNGTVNPNRASTTYYFQYGTTTGYGANTTSASAGSGSSAVSVDGSISGLACSTTYHYRLVATNTTDTSYGSDQTFTTSTCPPEEPAVTTGSATSVTSSSATLNGTVNPNRASTTYYFQYGTTTGYGTNTTSASAGSGSSTVSVDGSISGLACSTTYHYGLVATNSVGTSYGSDQTFTTSACPPEKPAVTTGSATSVTSSSATLNGTVNPNRASTTYYFQYGTTTGYGTNTTSASAGSGNIAVSVNAAIPGLGSSTLYQYQLVASDSTGTSYGSNAAPIPARIGGTVIIDGTQLTQATDEGYSFAATKPDGTDYVPAAEDTDGLNASNWYIIDIPIYDPDDQPGGAAPGDLGVIHVYKSGAELGQRQLAVGNSGSTTQIDMVVNTTSAGLACNTTYHYRLVAANSEGTSHGSDETFITDTCAPAGPIPDTGQTKCYNDSSEINCPQAGQDFYGQDANYTINPPSYTKLDASGNTLSDSAISLRMGDVRK